MPNDCVLKNLNISIPKGKLVAIIGDVGSGKSSFIYSLLGEMVRKENAYVKINGELSLVN